MMSRDMSWSDAELTFPGCSAQWDAQHLVDTQTPVVIFHNSNGSITVALADHVQRRVTRLNFWYWSVPQQRWLPT